MYTLFAAFSYAPFTEIITDLISDLVTPATTILGAVLAIAGAVLIVRIGFRWVRGFVK
jgi:hypothetical protein